MTSPDPLMSPRINGCVKNHYEDAQSDGTSPRSRDYIHGRRGQQATMRQPDVSFHGNVELTAAVINVALQQSVSAQPSESSQHLK